jgi:hypothetical protein
VSRVFNSANIIFVRRNPTGFSLNDLPNLPGQTLHHYYNVAALTLKTRTGVNFPKVSYASVKPTVPKNQKEQYIKEI